MRSRISETLNRLIDDYCAEMGIQRIWRMPTVRYADAHSPSIARLRDIVVPDHFMPEDFLPNPRTILSYFLPFIKEVIKSNVLGREASELWAHAYSTTNKMAARLNERLVEEIRNLGYHAAAPEPSRIGIISDEILMSRWSQRHIAHIAGHGTFGLNNMLISPKGCGGRYFSIVTDLPIEPDPMMQEELCRYKSKGTCKACVKRCVGDALSEEGFDRKKCFGVCLENADRYNGEDVCGKCVVGVPCSYIEG